MRLADLTLAGFLCLGIIRCFSYVPQIVCIARDEKGASAISYTTWWTWTLANLTTAGYAGLNLGDLYLAAVSSVYALGCGTVIALTMFKRAQYRKRKMRSPLLTDQKGGIYSYGGPFRRDTPRPQQRNRVGRFAMITSLPHGATVNT